MSQVSGGAPPSLTTIEALLSLRDFINSPEAVARVQELHDAEVAARNAHDSYVTERARVESLLDEHSAKVRAHDAAVAQLLADQAALKRAQDLVNRKVAKMREAESLK